MIAAGQRLPDATFKIMGEKDNWCFSERSIKLPYFPFLLTTRNFAQVVSPNLMKSFHIGKLGVMLEQDFHFKDLGPERCLVTLESRIEVPAIFKLLQ